MRNANESTKISYSAMMGEMESDPESVSWTRSLPKVNQFFRLAGSIIKPSFNEIG